MTTPQYYCETVSSELILVLAENVWTFPENKIYTSVLPFLAIIFQHFLKVLSVHFSFCVTHNNNSKTLHHTESIYFGGKELLYLTFTKLSSPSGKATCIHILFIISALNRDLIVKFSNTLILLLYHSHDLHIVFTLLLVTWLTTLPPAFFLHHNNVTGSRYMWHNHIIVDTYIIYEEKL